MQKVSHFRISGVIVAVSGLRIGGSDDVLEIGGTDLTCVKHPLTQAPYIPGSSLKGRMRSELESCNGLISGPEPYRPASGDSTKLTPEQYLLVTIFGAHKLTEHQFGPIRALFRDSMVSGDFRFEEKTEVISDRRTGTGQHPRKLERVAAGAGFDMRIDVHVLDLDQTNSHGKCAYGGKTRDDAMFEFLRVGLRLVELSGLGSGVSRGSGEVMFAELKRDGTSFDLNDVKIGFGRR
jgi:CRISPR-associated protein Csm3